MKITVDRAVLQDTMIREGDCKYFRCNCGSNVFKRIENDPPRFSCNGCSAEYIGESQKGEIKRRREK